jgi:allophanate hydrolase subunit 2
VYGHASLQGCPRVGLRSHGVPPGGAFDPGIQKEINRIVGNELDAVVVELAMCQFSAAAIESVFLVWAGAPVVVTINGLPSERQSARLQPGDTISFDAPTQGARVWMAAGGGFIRADSEPIKRGDYLATAGASNTGFAEYQTPKMEKLSCLRAIPERVEFANLFENRYVVGHDSNRVGIRLSGARMKHTLELPSEPAAPGVVQITSEGTPIILGPDGPTIGGYPRAAVIVSADIPKLAQLRPGDEVRFQSITIDDARLLS